MTCVRRDRDLGELTAILERAGLLPEERDKLQAALDTLAVLKTNENRQQGASILRLRRMLSGQHREDQQDLPRSAARRGRRRRASSHHRSGGQRAPTASGTAATARSRYRAVKVCVCTARASRGSLPECWKGKLYTQPPAGGAGTHSRHGAAGGHPLRARAAALQSLRRGVHGSGPEASALRSTSDGDGHESRCSIRLRAAVPPDREAASGTWASRCPRPPMGTGGRRRRHAAPRAAPMIRQAAQGRSCTTTTPR